MIREEIIIIKALFGHMEALNKIIEKQDKTIKVLEQEPCEDAVSRQAVLSKIKEVCFSEEWLQFRVDNGSNGQRDFLINYIEKLPPVTPQQKTGQWITHKEKFNALGIVATGGVKCSECDYTTHNKLHMELGCPFNYCPNCGAKMSESE